jgi:hypothetical protein
VTSKLLTRTGRLSYDRVVATALLIAGVGTFYCKPGVERHAERNRETVRL